MPLSEYEQRVREQLEADLGTDPKLGQVMSRGPRARGRLAWAIVGIFVGLAVVLAGAITQLTLLGIAGFAVMTGSSIWAISSPRKPKLAVVDENGKAKPAPESKPRKTDGGFMRRVEERFERRREQGDL